MSVTMAGLTGGLPGREGRARARRDERFADAVTEGFLHRAEDGTLSLDVGAYEEALPADRRATFQRQLQQRRVRRERGAQVRIVRDLLLFVFDTAVLMRATRAAMEAARGLPRLSGRLVVGNLGDRAIAHGRRWLARNPRAGYFDVLMHGTEETVIGEAGVEYSGTELAEMIRGTPSWSGQNIRLLSCSTGGCSSSGSPLAQGLADELGVAVRAPTQDVVVSGGGRRLGWPAGEQGSWLEFSRGAEPLPVEGP